MRVATVTVFRLGFVFAKPRLSGMNPQRGSHCSAVLDESRGRKARKVMHRTIHRAHYAGAEHFYLQIGHAGSFH